MNTPFSRSGASSPYGKCTDELKTAVPERIKEEFSTLSVINGITSGEYLRELVTSHLHGGIPKNMQGIVWQHVCQETDSELLRDLLHKLIFGHLHEVSMTAEQNSGRSEISRHYAANGGGK